MTTKHASIVSDSFLLVADTLAILIARAKEDGQVEGLIPHLVDGGISILQYAYDKII
jgi:hypothetical protein